MLGTRIGSAAGHLHLYRSVGRRDRGPVMVAVAYVLHFADTARQRFNGPTIGDDHTAYRGELRGRLDRFNG